jgi:leukotriene-A4 hydrolase
LLQLCINAEDPAVLPGVVDLLSSQGRMKYLRPLYRALYRSKMGRQAALDTFGAVKGKYHPIAAKMVAADLQG